MHCVSGHFVRDACHSADAVTLLRRLAECNHSADPIKMAEKAMAHSSLRFDGPECHALVPLAVLPAARNAGVYGPDGAPVDLKMMASVTDRGLEIPRGFCGCAGDCGACGEERRRALRGSAPLRRLEKRSAHQAHNKGTADVC